MPGYSNTNHYNYTKPTWVDLDQVWLKNKLCLTLLSVAYYRVLDFFYINTLLKIEEKKYLRCRTSRKMNNLTNETHYSYFTGGCFRKK